MELMARVADNIRITGRGVILGPDFASETARVRVGDQIELKSLGGSFTDAGILGVSHLRPLKGPKSSWGIALAPPLNEEEFEQGTEIWVVLPREIKPKS